MIGKLKEIFKNTYYYDVYFLRNENKVIIVGKKDLKNYKSNYTFIKENEIHKFVKNLDLQTLFDYTIFGININGHSLTENFWKEAKKRTGKIMYKNNKYDIKNIRLGKRFGAGAFVYNPNLKKFLILKYNIPNENYWGLTKGGIEENETKEETIIREVYEETGLKLDTIFFNKYFFSMHNSFSSNYVGLKIKNKNTIFKRYITWVLAITKQTNVKLSHEHLDYKWVNLKEAKEILTYEKDYDLIKRGFELIKNMK